ncbi:MAG: response regulator [Anaerolineae bacterium]|nr:response regulator [Anaerolineae bacterium]
MSHLILIVDDDAELRTLYRLILEREGYAVDEAANGADALKYLSNHVPDLIVMDMLMPMLGGEPVMRRIQQIPALRDVRIIVLTAYPRFRDTVRYLDADQFLVKPITPRQIVEAVRDVLSEEPRSEE